MTDLYIEEFLTHLEYDSNYNLYDLDNSISMDDLINYRKNSLFKNYNELIDLFTKKIKRVSMGFWNKFVNRLLYMFILRIKCEFYSLIDYYKLTKQLIHDNYGGGLLRKYNDSPYQLLKDVFPEYDWKFWMFDSTY